MDESTFPAVLDALQRDLRDLAAWLRDTPALDLAEAETVTLDRLRTIGARLLDTSLAARVDGGLPCACGSRLRLEGNRPKGVQTLVGWITLHRAYYHCPACGAGCAPRDATLGVRRDRHSPGVRRLASRFGAVLPFAQAARTLQEAAGVQLSASTVRTVTEALGTTREQTIGAAITAAWTDGWAPVAGSPPDRCSVAMDGVRMLGADGQGRAVKLGIVVPVTQTAQGERRGAARYTASLEPADGFGRRLARVAHTQHAEQARRLAVLGDGAAWIWNLADEHFPGAVQIVDWYHASERVWELGRALYGPETSATAAWGACQLGRLAIGQAATLADEWRMLICRGAAASVRDAQVTSFTNQASRMASDRYRADGWDIGSGMIESACKAVSGQREKGPGMRWTDAGAQTVANVRLLLCNDEWTDYWAAA